MVATAAFTVFRPAHSALLPALCVTPLQLTSANVVRGLVDSVSTLLGPLVAALLLDVGSPAAVFAATAALSVGSGALLLRLSYEAPPRGAPQPLRRIVRETAEGYRGLVRYRDAGLLFGIGLGQTLTRGFLNVFLVVMALELLDTGDSGVGVLTAAVGAGAVALAGRLDAGPGPATRGGGGHRRDALGPAAHPKAACSPTSRPCWR